MRHEQHPPPIGYYSKTLEGHRAAYLDFVTGRFGGLRAEAGQLVGWRGPLLFLMVEEDFGLYIFSCILRTLLGRRTAGLLFRPGPAITGRSWRLRLKRWILRAMRRLPNVRTISLLPTPLYPRISEIADDWIYDFQLWDLTTAEQARFRSMKAGLVGGADQPRPPPIFMEALAFASGRPLLVALGMQNRDKGADLLAASMAGCCSKGWAVLVAGRFASSANDARIVIESSGGKVIDRFLDSDEMLALYAAANAVWCLYDPRYDQASGILGRAVQLDVPVVVRCGSFSEALCKREGLSHAAANGGKDLANALVYLQEQEQDRPVPEKSPTFMMGEVSDLHMRRALGTMVEH